MTLQENTHTLRELLNADWARLMELCGTPVRPRRLHHVLNPRFAPVVLIRICSTLHNRGWRRLSRIFGLLAYVIFGIEVTGRLIIGPGLILPHTQGTVLGAAKIGANVTIYQQVTLGAKTHDFDFDPKTRPVIGDGVTLTSGAKVLGSVNIGDHSIVGANAVVIKDVPAWTLAIGVPAQVRPLPEKKTTSP